MTVGLKDSIKRKLIQQALKKKLGKLSDAHLAEDATSAGLSVFTDFTQHPAYQQIEIIREGAAQLGLRSPFFVEHEGSAGATSRIQGREFINFASYNYLNLAQDARVLKAVQHALEQYGASVSASRMVSGQRPIHRQLEQALAEHYQAQDALAFVSGHATNVTVIGYLMQPGDLILHDEWIHNSAVMGAQLSGAQRMAFRHNDLQHLEQLLSQHREQFKRVLILVEGLYSMDGDSPNLARLVELKERYPAWLMVDEAHSLGVLGETGKGLYEYSGVAPDRVDIWMGTLSKALCSCGGYIAGSQPLIDLLRHLAPGFLYSVGLSPSNTAAALASLQILKTEPERVKRLAEASRYFLNGLKQAGYEVGQCSGHAVVPLITGSSIRAAQAANTLFEQGINVQPVVYPAVPEKSARLRFFINADHTQAQLDETLRQLNQIKGLSA